jgi:hypothetical protein
MVKIKFFNSIAEAELSKNLLKECGIESMIEKRGLEFSGDLGDSGGADLFVADKDQIEVMKILGLKNEE